MVTKSIKLVKLLSLTCLDPGAAKGTKDNHTVCCQRGLPGIQRQASQPVLVLMAHLATHSCGPCRLDEALGRGPKDQAGASEVSRDEKRRPTVALVDRQLFERILFSFDTMPHHLPDTYLSAVQQL